MKLVLYQFVKSVLIVLFGGFYPVASTWANERNIDIAVGEWPPYLSRDLPEGGVVAKIISAVFRDMNKSAKIGFLPWGRAYEETARGEHGATGVWMHKQERVKDFIYSDPVLTEQFVFFHLRSTPFDWSNLKDVEGMTLGGGVKYSYGPALDAMVENGKVRIERVNDVHLNFKKLLVGRIDLYPQEINVGYANSRKHLSQEDQRKITHHDKPFLNNHSYLLFPRSRTNSRKIMLLFNDALKRFRDSGRYEQMMVAHAIKPSQ